MSQDTNVNNLVINTLTKQQYEGILSPSNTELYFITDDVGITSTDVTNALGYTPYNASNPSGYITSSDLPTNHVTTDTAQNITGTKTFVGSKKVLFKQASNSDKLGFTLYNSSDAEKGYLEYNPSNTVDSVPLMTLGNYASSAGNVTHVGFRKYSSVSGANGAYNLLAPLIADAKTPFNLTTTYTNFYLPLGVTNGTTTVTTAKSGLLDISSLLTGGSLASLSDVNISSATNGQMLTYDSTTSKWVNSSLSLPTATISTLGVVKPDGTTITIDANGVISGSASVDIDNVTITENTSNELQVEAIIEQNDGTATKVWTGTKAEYDEIGTYYAYVYEPSGSAASIVYVRTATPTPSTTVYDSVGVTAALTISSVGTGTITLSDGYTYTYSSADNEVDTTEYDSDTLYNVTDMDAGTDIYDMCADISLSNLDDEGQLKLNGGRRNVGEIVESAVPLTDASLHLMDGSLVIGGGIYDDFVDYIAGLYEEEAFVQPTLVENGVLGGSSFACAASTVLSGTTTVGAYGYAYYAFDGDASTAWHGASNVFPANLTFYNPKALKINKLTITNWSYSASTGATAGSVQGSHDGAVWTTLTTFTNSSTSSSAVWEINVNSSTFYKYHRIQVTSSDYGYAVIGNVAITAAQTKEFFTSEAEWQETVATYGSCGKFVYDSVNNTVRLPKITGIVEGTTDLTTLGDLVQAGLPAVTGTSGGAGAHAHGTDGATSNDDGGSYFTAGNSVTQGGLATQPVGNHTHSINITSNIYGHSNTVQPQTIKVLYYIVIATSTKTEIEVDIDEIATDLNGKADVDLSNATPSQTFKNSICDWVMPDFANQIIGTMPAFGSWVQVTKDSFVCVWGSDPYTENYNVLVSPDNGINMYVVGTRTDDTNGNTQTTSFTFFIPKNWYFICGAENGSGYRIYPLKGVN